MVRPSGESILSLFPLLTSHDAPTRLDASSSLINSLELDSASTNNVDTPYAIKRLVTGLGSSNEAARQGFAVALTELVARLPQDQAATVLPLILSTSTPNAGADSREERDLVFARLFGLHAIVRSGVLFRQADGDLESFKEVILALLSLSGKKSWIREPAYWVLIETVRNLLELAQEDAAPAWTEEATAWVIQRLLVDSREKARGWNPEKIALVIVLQTYGVEADYASVLAPTFPTGNPLARASLSALAQAIKGSAADADASTSTSGPKMGSNAVKTSKGGAPTPGAAPHFVWSEIFDLYFPDVDAKVRPGKLAGKEPKAKWADVWRILVDQSLFAPPSLPLKATGFALLTLAIQRLPPTDVPALFGEGTVRTFTNHLRKSGDSEKTLSRVADKLALALPTFLAANPTVSLPLIKALVAPPHGSPSFDPKTLEKLVAKLDLKGARGWVAYLKEFIVGEEQTTEDGIVPEAVEEKVVVARRLWAFDQLLHVVKSGSVAKDDELIAGLLEFFAVLGWFEVRKSGKGARSYIPTPVFNEALQLGARSRFFSILTSLPTPTTPSAQSWLSRALALLENLAADSKHFNPVDEPEEEVVAARASVKKMYGKLAGDDERKATARGLVEAVLILSYDEGEESLEALEQLTDILPLLFPGIIKASAPKAVASADDDEEMAEDEGEAPEPATVVVDLLLELLHRPSAFVKGVAQTVFTGFANELGEQGMELLLEQIRPEVAEEKPDADVEMEDAAAEPKAKSSKANGKKPEPVESSDDEEDEEDDDEDSDAEVDEDFRNELLAALQASGVAEEFDAAEAAGDDESDEELLDDDAMMALDDKLADIFRLQGGGGKSKKIDRTEDMHYRLRVVDLIEALAKQRSAHPLLVLTLIPLFDIVRSSSELELELQTKAAKILRQIVQSKKDLVPPASPSSSLAALAELHTIAASLDQGDLAPLCSQTAIYLVKSALASPGADASTSTAIATLFGDSFEVYLGKKNSKTKVQPSLTIEFCKRSPAAAWILFEKIVKLASSSSTVVNAYRRMQAFDVAQALLTSHAALKTDAAKAEILSAVPSYRLALLSALSPSSDLDASRLKDICKLTLAAVRLTTQASDAATTATVWDASSFVVVSDELKKSDRFKNAGGIQNSLKQIVGVIGGPGANASAAGGATNGGGKKDKKRKLVEAETKVEETVEKPTPTKKAKKVQQQESKKVSAPEVEVEVEEDDEVEVEEGSKKRKEGGKKSGKKSKDKKKA